jgi:hypothetical protein
MKIVFFLFIFIGFQYLVNSFGIEEDKNEDKGDFIKKEEAIEFLKRFIHPFSVKLRKETHENFEILEDKKYLKYFHE